MQSAPVAEAKLWCACIEVCAEAAVLVSNSKYAKSVITLFCAAGGAHHLQRCPK